MLTPQAGDILFFPKDNEFHYASGKATVNGIRGKEHRNTYCVFNAQVFLSSDASRFSCSGGPCPFIDRYKVKYVGKELRTCWTWGPEGPGAGNGVPVNFEANVFEVVGLNPREDD